MFVVLDSSLSTLEQMSFTTIGTTDFKTASYYATSVPYVAIVLYLTHNACNTNGEKDNYLENIWEYKNINSHCMWIKN